MEGVGPGLISTSPARRRMRKTKLAGIRKQEMKKADDGRLRYEKWKK